MDITGLVMAHFSASHLIPDDPLCSWNHGHAWTVIIAVRGHAYRKDGVGFERDIIARLRAITDEFHLRDLNVLLPGVASTPEGMAVYLYERLNDQAVTAITVRADEDYGATVEFTAR